MFKLDFPELVVSLVVFALCQIHGSAYQTLCAFSNALSGTVAHKLADAIPTVQVGEVAKTFTFLKAGVYGNALGQLSCEAATNELMEIKAFNILFTAPLSHDQKPNYATIHLQASLVFENGGQNLRLDHVTTSEWFVATHNCNQKQSKCRDSFATLEKEMKDHEAFLKKLNDMLKTKKWNEQVNAFKFLDATAVDSKLSKNADLAADAINAKAETLPYTDDKIKPQLKSAVFDRFFAANGKTFQLQSKPDPSDGFQVKVEITGKHVAVSENSAGRTLPDFGIRIRQFVEPVLQ